jgi:hypothetical protein
MASGACTSVTCRSSRARRHRWLWGVRHGLPLGPPAGERNRVTGSLATGIPEGITRSINLDYLDPVEGHLTAWAAGPDTHVVPDAGEDVYRLR